jgi:spore maturation protein CgeB
MRELGIISNRVYDALACGAFVVSDRVPGIDEEFDGAVATWDTPEELHEIIAKALADPARRAADGARGRAAVLARHTFEQRVDRILEVLLPRLARQEPAIEALAVRPAEAGPASSRPSSSGDVGMRAPVGAALDA